MNDRLEVLGQVVASQEALHAPFQGVVPEIAARAHLEQILPVIDETFRRAQVAANDLDAIAVAHTPGLAGSLLVGVVAAKTLSWVLRKPLIGINHLHGHIFACQLAHRHPIFPCVGLVVSGGHTNLFACHGAIDFRPLGATVDDAAGEAFDKVGSMLGLPFPGGPEVSRLAQQGNSRAFAFPRAFLHESDRLEFSFSGLKTAVRYALTGPGKCDFQHLDTPQTVKADIAASFEAAVVEVLVAKALRACQVTGFQRLCVGGGVAANATFRTALSERARAENVEALIASPSLCTDNAVLGAIAIERWKAGQFDDLILPIRPGLERARRTPA